MKTGIELIAAERRRQIDMKGFTAAHDDRHTKRELQWAALCYIDFPQSDSQKHFFWPWHPESWKPTGVPLRDLAKAGALIAAEIDRLLRCEARNARTTLPDTAALNQAPAQKKTESGVAQ